MDGTDGSSGRTPLDNGSARCKFCRRELREDFLFCPFCGGRIGPRDQSWTKWYHSRWAILLALALLGPFALPIVWSHPRYSVATKTVLTLLTLVLTVLLIYLLVVLWFLLVHQVQQLWNMY